MGEGGCRHENVAGARFCATCGVALGTSCPHCGAALSDRAAFCTSCGARLSAPGPSADVHGISVPVESAPRGPSRASAVVELDPILESHREDSWDIRIGRELLDSLMAEP